MTRMLLLATLFSVAAAAAPAMAEPLPVGGVTPADIVAVLQADGFKAQTKTDSHGDPVIESGADGAAFQIYFFDCKAGRCIGIEFSAGFDLPKGMSCDDINKWNREHRYGRAFLDDEKDPYVQMDRDFERGGTTEAIENELEVWVAVLREFTKVIHYWGDEQPLVH
jgi:hypothetical protein